MTHTDTLPYEKTDFEVADIFRRHGDAYRAQNKMTLKQHKVMSCIQNCRTSEFGHHLDQCHKCGHVERVYNSCRDRHCPKCQGISQRKWVEAKTKDVLPVPYYHGVFTLPHFLEILIAYNKALIYELLFLSASETLLVFGRDPKWLGGELGFHAVLHTWGQKLWQHPHLHVIIPGGALTADNQWVQPRYGGKFLFPVKALSKVFRGKFVEGLKAAKSRNELIFPDSEAHLNRTDEFERWIDQLVARKWVVYCKRPFKDPEHVIRYIGRYTHRVAISNNRIIGEEKGKVQFWYKDYKAFRAGGKLWDVMELEPFEFIRRFMFHVLPSGFHKIRNYGFVANGRRKAKFEIIRCLLKVDGTIEETTDIDSYCAPCPKCETGRLITLFIFGHFGKMITAAGKLFQQGLAWDTS